MEKRFELDEKDIYDNENHCYYGKHNLDRLVDLLNEFCEENKQLKQTQNSKAIEILEKVLCQIKNKLDTTKDKTFAQFDFMTFKPIIDFINNQITKLKEINNETSK